MNKFVLLLCGAVALTACRTNTVPPPPGPEINPHPKQVVRVHGRLPKSLDIKMLAQYSISENAFKNIPECRPRAIEGQFPIISDMMRQEELMIVRKGETYETTLIVDAVLPGRCEWSFEEVKTYVAREGKWVEEANNDELTYSPISSIVKDVPDSYDPVRACEIFEGTACPDVANSEQTPVLIRCEMFDVDWDKDPPSLSCDSFDRYKQVHVVNVETREIQIDFYDLTIDKDPYNSSL